MRHCLVAPGATQVRVPVPDRVAVRWEHDGVIAEWVEIKPGLFELTPRSEISWGQRVIELYPVGPYVMAYDAETDCLFCGRRAA